MFWYIWHPCRSWPSSPFQSWWESPRWTLPWSSVMSSQWPGEEMKKTKMHWYSIFSLVWLMIAATSKTDICHVYFLPLPNVKTDINHLCFLPPGGKRLSTHWCPAQLARLSLTHRPETLVTLAHLLVCFFEHLYISLFVHFHIWTFVYLHILFQSEHWTSFSSINIISPHCVLSGNWSRQIGLVTLLFEIFRKWLILTGFPPRDRKNLSYQGVNGKQDPFAFNTGIHTSLD